MPSSVIKRIMTDIKPRTSASSFPSNEELYGIDQIFSSMLSEELYYYLKIGHPLTVSKVPPEVVMRRCPMLNTIRVNPVITPASLRPVVNRIGYAQCITLPEEIGSIVPIYPSSVYASNIPIWSFSDHEYHLVGTVSASYLKYLEIILLEKWNGMEIQVSV